MMNKTIIPAREQAPRYAPAPLSANHPPARVSVDAVLRDGIHPRLLKAEAGLLTEISGYFRDQEQNQSKGQSAPLNDIATGLGVWIVARLDRIAELHRINEEFGARVARAADETERRAHVLDFARALGASERTLRGDARAQSRWFGHDAVAERYRRRVSGEERRAAFGLDRLGAVAIRALAELPAGIDPGVAWRQLGVEMVAARLFDYEGDSRVRAAAFRCLVRALEAMPPEFQERAVGETTLRRIYRTSLQAGLDVWSQGQALDLLATLSPDSFREILAIRLREPKQGDDLWVRRQAATLLCRKLETMPDLAALVKVVAADPSAAVRQALAMALHHAPPDIVARHLPDLILRDGAPEVRAAALASLPALMDRVGPVALADLWRQSLRGEENSFVLRTALSFAEHGLTLLLELFEQHGGDQDARRWYDTLIPEIERLHTEARTLAVRRWAAQARERMWCRMDPEAHYLANNLRHAMHRLDEGDATWLWRLRVTIRRQPDIAGRVLAVFAQSDFGFDLDPGGPGPLPPRLRRGDRFRFRLWRAWHEFRNPSPDKRQAFDHTMGRIYPGTVAAPSAVMAELAETKVPGEPFFMPDEAGWRPYLPLVDHALSALDTGRTVRLHTSEGVTEMEPPRSLIRRIRARLRLTLTFPHYASLRNWTEQRNQPPSTYLRALRDLGLDIRIRPYDLPGTEAGKTSLDPAVTRFFPAMLPFADSDLWRRLESYFFSVYQNTVQQLAVFITVVLLWFIGRHVWMNARMRRNRGAIPLVLGGWGTRGKSGTERLKAAMISALGYSLVSKTTGCEAMFLYGDPFGQVREMFLFRPYDKATIWEQFNIVGLARRLGAGVFLWECMGLTPSYVKVLQRHWMRDDISTITNTYPDHEDLQGPAGRNIPEVMTNFMPERGTVLTTEEQMRPILADAARSLGTRLVGVGWLEAGLLPSDTLKRFPYEEHPFNIALVLALADELGVDRDFALKEMADRVIADLGVLKTYPAAPVKTRRLEFVNGMSANERFGALGNWLRMGFDRQDPFAEPGVWITTVVNNRADRVPRSRVFASILVNDISADRHVLIGGNLEGFRGYIDEAWSGFAANLTLWPDTGTGELADPVETLHSAARRMRVPHEDEHVEGILRAMLNGQPEPLDAEALLALRDQPDELRSRLDAAGVAEAEGIVKHLAWAREHVAEYQAFLERVRAESDRKQLDSCFAELLRTWFRRKILVVEDYYSTGDQTVERIRAETPPGFFNRIMGVQNIKGTGLDFVYRWQAWDACHQACEMAESGDPALAAQGVRMLAGFQEFGVLSEERVKATVARLRETSPVPGEAFQAQLDLMLSNLDRQMTTVRESMAVTRTTGPLATAIDAVEAFLDAGDAVRRRRKADRIYRDMVTERISHDRAALELKKLNSRQKGGWLGDAIQRLGARLRAVLPAGGRSARGKAHA
jgi:poly-gamma-glutamate synthase PgsB/CapB